MDGRHNLFVSSDGSVESGWTVYLENSSSLFSRRIDDSFDVQRDEDEEEEELDLSMVSDASSGPPIFPENELLVFPENEAGRFFCAKTAGSLQKTGRQTKGRDDRRRYCNRREQTASFLDDTASSDPNFNFNNSESSSCQKQLKSMRQSSVSGNQRQKDQWFKAKRGRD